SIAAAWLSGVARLTQVLRRLDPYRIAMTERAWLAAKCRTGSYESVRPVGLPSTACGMPWGSGVGPAATEGRRGDEYALAKVYDLMSPVVFGLAGRILRAGAAAALSLGADYDL